MILLAVPADGLPAEGNPLNVIDGPVVVVTLLTIDAVSVINVLPDDEPLPAIE